MPVAPESLQPILLSVLASSPEGKIEDTRELRYDGVNLESAEEQGVVRAVLDSLASKEVGF
jgi:phenylalanyl-tRNA synthetase alpha chain